MKPLSHSKLKLFHDVQPKTQKHSSLSNLGTENLPTHFIIQKKNISHLLPFSSLITKKGSRLTSLWIHAGLLVILIMRWEAQPGRPSIYCQWNNVVLTRTEDAGGKYSAGAKGFLSIVTMFHADNLRNKRKERTENVHLLRFSTMEFWGVFFKSGLCASRNYALV